MENSGKSHKESLVIRGSRTCSGSRERERKSTDRSGAFILTSSAPPAMREQILTRNSLPLTTHTGADKQSGLPRKCEALFFRYRWSAESVGSIVQG